MDSFERQLTPEQQADPRFAFRVFMVHKTANRAPGADLAVELVPPGSDIAEKFNMALKEVEKRKYLPKEIVRIIGAKAGIVSPSIATRNYGNGWRRKPGKGYGAVAVGKSGVVRDLAQAGPRGVPTASRPLSRGPVQQ